VAIVTAGVSEQGSQICHSTYRLDFFFSFLFFDPGTVTSVRAVSEHRGQKAYRYVFAPLFPYSPLWAQAEPPTFLSLFFFLVAFRATSSSFSSFAKEEVLLPMSLRLFVVSFFFFFPLPSLTRPRLLDIFSDFF